MSESIAATAAALPHGWQRLDRAGWWGTFAAHPATIVLVAIVPINLGSSFARAVDIAGWWGLLFGLGLVVPVVLALYLVQRLRYPQPWVNFDSSELRAGRRVVPLADITWARLDLLDRQRTQTRLLTLRFGAEAGPRTSVRLRGRNGNIPSVALRTAVAEIVRRSSITVPQTTYDPRERFTRYNFPGSLSRDAALEVVLAPPTIDDPAPVEVV